MTSTDPEEKQRLMRLNSIFMPYATKHIKQFYEPTGLNARFAHYTSAEGAFNIIKTKRIWMRNTTCMSDYSEVNHGYDILFEFFSSGDNRERFIKALEGCASGVAPEAIRLFDQWWFDIRNNTYIAAISEHDIEEDIHGRLSMWRAFGGNVARVAIVLNVPWEVEGYEALKLQFSPVAYLRKEDVFAELNQVINNVHTDIAFLCSLDRLLIVNMIFHMLVIGVVCLKHKGFHEEREWRVIYAPKRLPSPLIEFSTEILGGIPQTICKIPIDNTVPGISNSLDLSKLFDRLIIGPSPYPWVMYNSFVEALTEAGVADAGGRVFVSDIPIRT